MSKQKTVKIGIADEQKLFTHLLRKSFCNSDYGWNCEVLWEAHSGDELIALMKQDKLVDLLFMELKLPNRDGIDLIKEIKEKWPTVRVCILTEYDATKFVKRAFQQGADGFILKQSAIEDVIKGVDEVLDGVVYMGRNVSIGPQNGLANDSPRKEMFELEDSFLLKNLLTRREKEILFQIAAAKNNKDIAKELYISDQTVSVHRKNIMKKLKVSSTAGLLKVAIKHGLVN